MRKLGSVAGVILTLNEADVVRRALRSLEGCGEVFVIDSGSSDDTVKIAREESATVLVNRLDGPFRISEQRNWALDNCMERHEWCLFLDADEEIGKDLWEVLATITSSSESVDAYEMTPRYWFLGKWLKRTQGFPNWHPRLVKANTARFKGGVWESFDTTSRVGKIKTPYEHYGFAKGIDDWIERHLRYAEWDAMNIHKRITSVNDNDSEYLARKSYFRNLSMALWWARPLARFVQKYFFNWGFVDGWQGLLYSLLMAVYEIIVVVKVIERIYRSAGRGL